MRRIERNVCALGYTNIKVIGQTQITNWLDIKYYIPFRGVVSELPVGRVAPCIFDEFIGKLDPRVRRAIYVDLITIYGPQT